ARIALDAVQRAAHGTRVGAKMRADGFDIRRDVGNQAQERLAHMVFIGLLVRVEPRFVVVGRQLVQESEAGRAEIDAHRLASRSLPQASRASSRASLSASPACSVRSRAISAR